LTRRLRYQRVASLFEDNFGLMPLEAWLPSIALRKPHEFGQIATLLNRILEPTGLRVVNLLDRVIAKQGVAPEILFSNGTIKLPLNALSDGYRTYIAWVGDMLYHLYMAEGGEVPFARTEGVVLVDEVDLHYHPSWQQTILKTLSELFPKIQFILSSHSPLVAGSLPACNLFAMKNNHVTKAEQEVQGMDADQILLSPLFDLKTTRDRAFYSEREKLQELALAGDSDARLKILKLYASGVGNIEDAAS